MTVRTYYIEPSYKKQPDNHGYCYGLHDLAMPGIASPGGRVYGSAQVSVTKVYSSSLLVLRVGGWIMMSNVEFKRSAVPHDTSNGPYVRQFSNLPLVITNTRTLPWQACTFGGNVISVKVQVTFTGGKILLFSPEREINL